MTILTHEGKCNRKITKNITRWKIISSAGVGDETALYLGYIPNYRSVSNCRSVTKKHDLFIQNFLIYK